MPEENTSRLLSTSAQFRNSNLIRNSCRYVCNNEYNTSSKDILSDGDNRGRDPEGENGTVGTNLDIACRNSQLALNSGLYLKGSSEYGDNHPNTLSDGDEKGRNPENEGGTIGTCVDIQHRNFLIGKNICRYTSSKVYDSTSPDVFSDGDNRGRDPDGENGTIGTITDIQQRNCTTVRNCYHGDHFYGESNC